MNDLEPRVLIYMRIKEIEEDIARNKKLLYAAHTKDIRKMYEDRIARLESLKQINQAIFYQTTGVQ